MTYSMIKESDVKRMQPRRGATIFSLLVLLGIATSANAAGPKVITVTLSGPLAPYNYRLPDGGAWVGLSADALDYAAKKAGYTVTYKPMAFENEIPALQTGRVDVASGIYVTKKRAETLSFIPLIKSYFGIIMRKEDAGDVHSWTDLCGKKIGMHFAASTQQALKKMNAEYCKNKKPAIAAPTSGSITDILNSIQNKRVYGAIDDVNMWDSAVKMRPEFAVSLTKLGQPIYWPLAFKKGSGLREDLLPGINEFLNSPLAEKVSKKYGMTKNVFIKDPEEALKNILGTK